MTASRRERWRIEGALVAVADGRDRRRAPRRPELQGPDLPDVGFVEEGRLGKHVRRKNGELWDLVEMGLLL